MSIKKILNLNDAVESTEADDAHASGSFLAPAAPILKDGRPIWKVLVFDVSISATGSMGGTGDAAMSTGISEMRELADGDLSRTLAVM